MQGKEAGFRGGFLIAKQVVEVFRFMHMSIHRQLGILFDKIQRKRLGVNKSQQTIKLLHANQLNKLQKRISKLVAIGN